MTSYWAIAIGINQYKFFQPLIYAQRDARAMRDFWVGEAGFAPDQCLMLIDSDAKVERGAIYPNRENVRDYVTQLCQEQLPAGGFLWCFFSGYGMQFEGQDYLMPIDGDPEQVATTGIAVEEVFKLLKAAPTDKILLTLDMNRSKNALAGEGIGEQTIALADTYGIATLLSCQPEQTSHETLALRQGLFTAALLEGLRYRGCITSDSLAHYLSDRLPALSDYHWRPKQQPLAIIPVEQRHQLILPQQAIAKVGADYSPDFVASDLPTTSSISPSQSLIVHPTQPSVADDLDPVLTSETLNGNAETLNGKGTNSPASVTSVDVAYEDVESESDDVFWQRVQLWGSVAVLLLFLGVLLSNWAALRNSFFPAPEVASEDSDGSDGIEAATSSVNSSPADPETSSPPAPAPSPDASSEGASSFMAAPESPDAEALPNSEQPSPTAENGEGQSTPPATIGNARAALQNQRQEEAIALLDQIPTEQRTEDYTQLRTEAEQALNQARQRNQAVLNNARAVLSRSRALNATNQASDFSQAIIIARQVRPGQPLYQQAQQSIATWSQVILDLAEGRAGQGNLNSAIAAARLVPSSSPEVYSAAQQSIARWQQQQANQETLQQARSLIRRNQASSYNRAITIARQIPANQPLHNEAQQLIGEWSQAILDLARSRAERGRLNSAVQTAALVPANTPAHTAAQEAIASWRSQL
ncbi:caspase family protein [Leptolyngbya sp. FACHB-541]|uniref:caspase family protein n=1 Tax=Leptolyngbya sp. FACHB-541 TaxID=2692810 RepID=UPI00168662DA|nr:caspase family protein [Leptolyngbya sp. FACHB-541]MBD1999864.1 caspase family protein [Leptolyngbya sp. FACHB-541]